MAIAFVRTFDLLRILERSFSHVERVRNIIKTSPNEFLRNYVQCHCYHATSTCFMGKSKKEKKFVPAIVKPKNHKVVGVWKNMTIDEFAIQADRPVSDVEEALSIVNITNYSTKDPISNIKVFSVISKLLGLTCKSVKPPEESVEKALAEEEIHTRSPIDEASLIKRRPIVTVMGHVDHGKTTLLDALRSTSVVESEFGGITQHIGAFNVTLDTGEAMTFLDTPGHAAFTAMRARGAQVTDIVVLVVAADDGVMAQTVQSIELAKEAKVPIVVAINKIDRPNADVTRTQKMLAQHGILVEEIGGDIQAIQISALHKTNLNTLVEAIAIQAEMMNLKGDPKGLAEGVIVESSNESHRGKLATVLVQRGSLKRGTILVCGLAWAKVRSMFDDAGNLVPKASLSDAVQVIGWRQMPSVGDEFFEVENDVKANRLIKFRTSQVNLQKSLTQEIVATAKLKAIRHEYETVRKKRAEISKYRHIRWMPSTDNKQDDTNKLNVIVKGDVSGSVEAILDIFETYNQEKDCRLNVVHYGVGDITETDVTMAEMFNGIIYRFNVDVPLDLSHKAKEKNISIRPFKVIYKLIDDLKDELGKKMPMQEIEDVHGEATVLQEFKVTEQKKKVNVAGCSCTKGNLKISAKFRLLRNGEVIHSGTLASMRHMKEEVETIKTNTECGLRFKNNDVSFQKGDVIICYSTRMAKVQLKWNPGF